MAAAASASESASVVVDELEAVEEQEAPAELPDLLAFLNQAAALNPLASLSLAKSLNLLILVHSELAAAQRLETASELAQKPASAWLEERPSARLQLLPPVVVRSLLAGDSAVLLLFPLTLQDHLQVSWCSCLLHKILDQSQLKNKDHCCILAIIF